MCLIIAYLPQIISVIQFICVDGFFLYTAFKDCLSRRKKIIIKHYLHTITSVLHISEKPEQIYKNAHTSYPEAGQFPIDSVLTNWTSLEKKVIN